LSCNTYPCVVSPKEKEKKRNINNDLAILPSHDNQRTHNLPTAEEIAVIIPENRVYHALNNRNVVL